MGANGFLSSRSVSRRGLLGGAAAVSLGLTLPGCGSSSLSQDESGGGAEAAGPLKVGLLVPLSGVYAPLGEDMQAGWELYLSQHDGQLGGREIETVVADEGTGPESGVPAAQRLVQRDEVDVIVGVVNSAVALGIRDLVTDAEVPLIVANAGANDITGTRKSPYIWRTSFSNRQPGIALGAYVAEQVGDGGVYLIAADYAAGREFAAAFGEAFEEAGGTIAGSVYPPFGTTQDYQPFLSGIQESGAVAAFAFFAGSEAVRFVQQYSEFGLAGQIALYGPGFLTEGTVLEAQGAAAEGVETALHYSSELDTPENGEFVAAYEDAYGGTPTVYSTQAYDAASLLDKGLAAAGGDASGLVDGFGQAGDLASPRGSFELDANHNPAQTYYLRRVTATDEGYVNAVVQELGVISDTDA